MAKQEPYDPAKHRMAVAQLEKDANEFLKRKKGLDPEDAKEQATAIRDREMKLNEVIIDNKLGELLDVLGDMRNLTGGHA